MFEDIPIRSVATALVVGTALTWFHVEEGHDPHVPEELTLRAVQSSPLPAASGAPVAPVGPDIRGMDFLG